MEWLGLQEKGSLKWATALVTPGDGQPDHTHPEFQTLVLEDGRIQVWSPSYVGELRAPARIFFLAHEPHRWEALEPSIVFSLWKTPGAPA